MHQRASWNPARRNRRTGTAASGYKRRAPFAIPAPFGRQREPRAFHEQLHTPVIVWRQVAGHSLCFAVEPPHLPGGFFHPCTVDDLCAVLAGCPPHDVARVRMIVLRQPTQAAHFQPGVGPRIVRAPRRACHRAGSAKPGQLALAFGAHA